MTLKELINKLEAEGFEKEGYGEKNELIYSKQGYYCTIMHSLDSNFDITWSVGCQYLQGGNVIDLLEDCIDFESVTDFQPVWDWLANHKPEPII